MAGVAAPQPPQQPPRAPTPSRRVDDSVTLNFVNADLQAVIKAVADITGRNILIDPRVTGTVNIVAPSPVPRSAVFSVLLSALRAQGFAAVGGDGAMVRIVPEAEAKFFPGIGDNRSARGDQVVTQVFQLSHESAQQLVPVLRPLVSPNNVINAVAASNTLIITDYAENLRRISRVIASVDQPNPGELLSIRLRHAAAVDVAQTITRLVPEAAQAGGPGMVPKVAVTVDARSNSVLVRADNPALARRIREVAEAMDTPGTAQGNINVVYLKNAEATKLAETLRGILSGQTAQRGATSSTPPPPAPSGLGGAPAGITQPGGIPGQPGIGTQALGGSFTQTGAPAQAPSAFTAGGATVQAYPETNSLVIIAPDNIYNALRSVIDKLDARRAQIFVEALILEMTSSKAAEFGVQWQALNGINSSGTSVIGGTNFGGASQNILGIASKPAAAGQGLNLGVMRGKVTIGGAEFLNLAFLARALETDSAVNILSTPNLLTLDNEEARIIVGQNIPIVTGSFTLGTTGGTAGTNPFQTFDRRDVGLTLRVRPTVAEGGSVKLQIFQEVSSVFDKTNPAGIITNKRALESTVIVDDGQTIVLGGLISDDTEVGSNRVPVLGSIPILGNLFRYENRSRTKTNLMVFLRPVVIRDQEAAANVTGNRYDYIRGLQQGQQPPQRPFLPDMSPPDLPGIFERDPRGGTREVPPGAPRAATPPSQPMVSPPSAAVGTTASAVIQDAVRPAATPAVAPAISQPAAKPAPGTPQGQARIPRGVFLPRDPVTGLVDPAAVDTPPATAETATGPAETPAVPGRRGAPAQ